MAISDQIQMLISTFIFGSLSQATIAALFLYINGHGSAILKDRRRLVLVLFLASSALWAQIDFIGFVIPTTSLSACQFTTIGSAFFDQAARVIISAFLLWSVARVNKTQVETSALTALIGSRAVAGVVFVAFTRPQFAPVCAARSDLLPASIIVMVLDLITIGILIIKLLTLGLLDGMKDVRPGTKQEQNKALVFCITTFLLWTLTSTVMMIGMPSIALLLRTALPAIGLVTLVWVITTYAGVLILSLDNDSTTPEARSPFVAPASHSSDTSRNGDGSPIREDGYTRTANLFVVNPSDNSHDSSAMAYLEDVKAEDECYSRYQSTHSRSVTEQSLTGGMARSQVSTGNSRSTSAATIDAINSAVFLAAPRQAPLPASTRITTQAKDASSTNISTSEIRPKCARFGWSKKSADKSVRRIIISNPVMQDTESVSALPFTRMRTIDLAAAAASERERRDDANKRQLVANRPAPAPPIVSEAWRKSRSTKRKEVPRGASVSMTLKKPEKALDNSSLSVALNANSTSASLSPGREDVRRRSPRSVKTVAEDIETSYFLASRPHTIGAPKNESEEIVMYVNDIIYDDPNMVKSIVEEAPTIRKSLLATRYRESIRSSKSLTVPSEPIIHRSRPHRRDSEKDRLNLVTPDHKRSKSGPLGSTKLLDKGPEFSDLVNLPAVPQRPTTAAGLRKLLPNDTQSMTVDEKISMLFPAPPGVHHLANRRSSVPSLPRIPSSILLGEASRAMLADQDSLEHRASKRSTISFGSQIPNDGITPITETPIISEHGIYRFSANTYRTLAGSPKDYLLPDIPVEARHIEYSHPKIVESDASNSPRQSTMTSLSSVEDDSHDGSKSAWASIHSPVPAIDVTTAQMTARETYIKMRNEATIKPGRPETHHAPYPRAKNDQNLTGNGEGFMTIMSGMGNITRSSGNVLSFLMSPSPLMMDNDLSLPPAKDAWHRRIGDELPAFSQRRKNLRSRTMPPPTPLLLGSNRRLPPVIIRKSPVDQEDTSPERALQEIQAQLRKFEAVTRESLRSVTYEKEQDSSKSPVTVINDQFGLLENLEKEMGQQETFWMRMQHNFDRDSNSIIMTPQLNQHTPQALPSPPSDTSSIKSVRSIGKKRRSRNRSIQTTPDIHIHSPNISRANIWQRLAHAQMEYMENGSRHLGPGNINFLSISKAQQLSPTPPDSLDSASESGTDTDYDMDVQSELEDAVPSPENKRMVLWLPRPSVPVVRTDHLWSYTHEMSGLRTTSFEPAAKGVRPFRQRDLHPLSITSLDLWSKPNSRAERAFAGLWRSKVVTPKVIIDRPKAQRPIRKSKRVTFLPAIVENPSPLPYKRDTLGIFQFPWGEKSDSAIYDPIPVPDRASLVPIAFDSKFVPKPIQSGQEPAEYSSSFFDDYEDDFEEEYGGGSEANSDDDFDESTLWEIATLLDSQDVPSRNSLFPFPRIIEDYDEEDNSEPELNEITTNSNRSTSTSAWPAMVKFVPVQPLKPLPPLPIMQDVDNDEQIDAIVETKSTSSPLGWQVYLPALDNAVRGASMDSLNEETCLPDPGVLQDNYDELDSNRAVEKVAALWSQPRDDVPKKASPFLGYEYEIPIRCLQESLWTAKAAQAAPPYRRINSQLPAALKVTRKTRVDNVSLATLSTSQLWSRTLPSLSEYHWISISSIRVPGPSLCSAYSSGKPSPSSDETSIASMTTRASFHKTSNIVIVQDTAKGSRQLWNPISSTTDLTQDTNSLWSKSSTLQSRTSATSSLMMRDISARKSATYPLTPVLDILSSTSFWTLSISKVPVKHWLHTTSQKPVPASLTSMDQSQLLALPKNSSSESTMSGSEPESRPELSDLVTPKVISIWTAPSLPDNVSTVKGKGLWTPAKAKEQTSHIVSTHMVSLKRPANKSATTQASLGKIKSTELWRPKWGVPESPRDWLTSRKSRKVDFRY